MADTTASRRPRNAYCSFCRKGYQSVGPLVEGPDDVYICGGCVELCQSIIEQEKRRRGSSPLAQRTEDLRPRLDALITGHTAVKDALVAVTKASYQPRQTASQEQRLILLTSPSRSSRLFWARALAA